MHRHSFNNFLVCTVSFLIFKNICRSYCEIVAWGNPHKHNDNLTPCPSNMFLFSGRRAFSWLSHVILISDGDWLWLSSWWTLDQDYAASPEQKNRECPTSKQWLVGRASSWNACLLRSGCALFLSDCGRPLVIIILSSKVKVSVRGLLEFIWRPCAHCGLWLALRSGPEF